MDEVIAIILCRDLVVDRPVLFRRVYHPEDPR